MTTATIQPVDNIRPKVKAAILRAVAGAAHPRLEIPNVAHRHGLTIDQVQAVLTKHGYPRPPSMLRAAQILESTAEIPDGETFNAPPDEPAGAAAANGIDCPTRGRLPKAIVDRYLTEHGNTTGNPA